MGQNHPPHVRRRCPRVCARGRLAWWEKPVRLPNAVMVDAALAPPSADVELALSRTFPGFDFTIAPIDDFYWRGDGRTVLSGDDARLPATIALGRGRACRPERRPHRLLEPPPKRRFPVHRMARRQRLRLRATGPGVADLVQISLGARSRFWRAPWSIPITVPTAR